jgi:hypothetical protein
MTPTQKQIQERLHRMRDEGAEKYADRIHHTLETADARVRSYKAGADSRDDIIMKLVAGLEFYAGIEGKVIVDVMIHTDDEGWEPLDDGTKARQLLEELKGEG